jgi:hypothetical protein
MAHLGHLLGIVTLFLSQVYPQSPHIHCLSGNFSKTLLRISCSTNELANLGGGAISLAKSA